MYTMSTLLFIPSFVGHILKLNESLVKRRYCSQKIKNYRWTWTLRRSSILSKRIRKEVVFSCLKVRLPILATQLNEVTKETQDDAKMSTSSKPTEKAPWLSKESFLPVMILNLVTILWGTQHAVIKQTLQQTTLSASDLNFYRFLLAAMLITPFVRFGEAKETPSSTEQQQDRQQGTIDLSKWSELKAGLELGFWMFAGYAMQSIGLEWTTASRSAFLLYLNVKLVPLFALILYGRRAELTTWISAALALVGTCLLSNDGAPPNIGDAWSLAAAGASAMFILRLETFAKNLTNLVSLNAISLWTVAILSGLWCFVEKSGVLLLSSPSLPINSFDISSLEATTQQLIQNSLPILYLGGVTTALTNYLQTLGQNKMASDKAAVIYAMDPVYAASFSYILLGEKLGTQGLFGAFVIMFAVLMSQRALKKET